MRNKASSGEEMRLKSMKIVAIIIYGNKTRMHRMSRCCYNTLITNNGR